MMTAESSPEATQHLAPLVDGQWSLWRWAALRGSGFPSQQIATLASPACAAAADSVVAARSRVEQRRQELLGCIRASLDRLRDTGQWDDASQRRPLLEAITQVNKGKLPKRRFPADAGLSAAIEALAEALAVAERTQSRVLRMLHTERPALLKRLWAMARDVRFCEALLWQNREAYQTLKGTLLGHASGMADDAAPLRESELVLRYLQRYYTKNDSIGFFGPIGWATLVIDGPPIRVAPGATLVTGCTVAFEQWCVDRLAAYWSRLDGMRRWIAPRRLPTIWLTEATLQLAGQTVDLPDAQAAILRAVLDLCDGTRTAGELTAVLLANRSTPLADERAVYQLLETMEASGLISWAFELSVHPDSFEHLVEALRRVGDPVLSAPTLRAMEQLELDRRAIAAAAGNPTRLEMALSQLAAHFTAITDQPASQAYGRTYAARTLVYQDCCRAVDATVGPQLLQALSAPLGLLLTSARWITFQLAQSCRALFTTIYRQMASEVETQELPLTAFWQRVQPYLSGTRTDLIDPIVEMFQQHWGAILQLPADKRDVQYCSVDLRLAVADLFAAPGPGWSTARHHSPDILIAADSLAAINAGAYSAVMGELHVGANTLRAALFVRQHPAPDELLDAIARDIPEPCIIPVEPKHWPGVTARTHNLFVTAKDFRLLVGSDTVWPIDDPQTLQIGSMLITEVSGELQIHSYDWRHQFDCIEFASGSLAQLAVNLFKILPDRSHTPRVSIDRLVVARETWRFNGVDFAPLFALAEAQQFIELRRWMWQHGFPRYVFVRISTEPKPVFVDLANPLLVALLVKMVRQACSREQQRVRVSIVEMLPALDALWLTDVEGQLYTSELRLIAVDQAGRGQNEDWGYL